MDGQKRLEIPIGNPHQSIHPVRDEESLFDPAPHRTRRHFDEVGDLLDRVEFRGGPIGFHLLTPKYL
jgi:hypothetical protein